MVMGAAGCKKTLIPPTEDVPASKITTVVSTPDDAKPAPGQKQVLGNGWYANVEVGSDDTIHLAWTWADNGDVLYATASRDGAIGTPEPVEVMGAVGSYLQLALGPADVPVLAYYHQTERTLRVAVRDADLEKMKDAGAEVVLEGAPPPRNIPGERPDPPDRMGSGWVGEDVTFGDNVGLGGSLTLDSKGYPHLAYYARADRMRYARRKAGDPAFGPPVRGQWDLLDVDREAGASFSMRSDIVALDSGVVVVSFCHWNFVDAQMKVGVLRPDQKTFQIVASPLRKEADGWNSTIVPRPDGVLDIYSIASSEHLLLHTVLDPAFPSIPAERPALMERPGPAAMALAPDGTVWVLTRGVAYESLGEKNGVWLAKIPGGDPARIERWVLDVGRASDPWLDLALLSDGTPVAVWTTADHKAMKLYIHDKNASASRR
jgi:hypothetical protein